MLKERTTKTNLIVNSLIDLKEDDGNGKGRYFVSRFIEPGLAHYKELGDIVITKETLDKFIQSMVGCPVIIDHKDVTDKNVDKLRVGTISRVWYDEHDGWYYCEGILTDDEAIDLVKNQGWNVSCSYSFVSDESQKTYHGKPIDMVFTDGEFLHLAIVEDPRYEGANIVVNKKDDDLEWITVKGNHIPIKKGQTKDEAVKEFLEEKQSDTKNKHGFKKDKDSGYYMKDLSDGTSVYVEKKEGGQGEKEPFFLEATHFDKDGKEIAKKQYHYDSMDGMFDKIDRDFVSKDKQYKKESSDEKTQEKLIKDISVRGANGYGLESFTRQGSYEAANKLKAFLKANKNKTLQEIVDGLNKSDLVFHDWSLSDGFDGKAKISDYEEVGIESEIKGPLLLKEKSNKTNNSIGDITMTVLNDLTDFIKKVVKNEKEDEMAKVKNEDKRKLIDEIGGILKGKVDDEIIRTVIKKAEELSYEPSEDDKADNKCKNEEDDKKEDETENKCKNEEEEKIEEKEEKVEDEDDEEDVTKNKKVKNSLKDLVMGGNGKAQEQKLYVSRKERLEEGNKY